MKKGELIKTLKKSGCYLKREGTRHEIWVSPITQNMFEVPRHAKEITVGTLNKILKDAGLK